ncbi:MAG: hypothetical protein ING29_01010 [Azospirillum sp.]|nr:hypothetical protein [Azospirillum sp.]
MIVHAASHSDAMLLRAGPGGSKIGRRKVFRMFGYGVPNLGDAIESAANRAVVIHQAEIQPFRKDKKEGKINELKFFALPIPSLELSHEFPAAQFRLRVTLSYFIEPNPGGRTYRGKYGYASHRLGFRIQVPGESEAAFRARLQDQAAAEDDVLAAASEQAPQYGEGWTIGNQIRNASTVQSDWIDEDGAKLAYRRLLAVYPMSGWWKNRPKLDRIESKARFSLIVSLEADQAIDIYTPVKAVVETATQITA